MLVIIISNIEMARNYQSYPGKAREFFSKGQAFRNF